VWGPLVCNSAGSEVSASDNNNFFQAFPVGSWQGIISIVAIIVVFLLCVVMIIYACWRCRRKQTTEHPQTINMATLPPYTPQGDFVFPGQYQNPPPDPDAGDPFAADKTHVSLESANSIQEAAEKVRQDQQAAFDRLSRASEEGKHDGNGIPGFGGVSRVTVT